MDGSPDNRFTLEEHPPAIAAKQAIAPIHALPQGPVGRAMSPDDILRAQAASGIAAYCWNVVDDSISWSSNASGVLHCDVSAITTWRKFADFLDGDNTTSRYDTVMASGPHAAAADGVAFDIEYCFRPNGRHDTLSLWIEDIGHWYGSADNGPEVVYGVLRVVDERHSRNEKLNVLSNSDELTGMMNHARMFKALDEAIANTKTEKSSCAFAILSINNLNVMNETYGYEVADEVIVAMAERLRRVMRVGDGIARYSGSKFGIILNDCGLGELEPALERFMHAVRDNVIETSLGPIWALLSIGAVNLPALGDTAQTAAAFAEEALSEALRLPGDGYIIYASSEERKSRRLLNARCATEIVGCLRDGHFKLAFQPVADVKNSGHLFYEGLLRMQDSTGALVTAGHLVPVAEDLGLIRLIDRTVVQMALAMLAQYPMARLSINLSTITVKDPRWNIQILDAIASAPELAPRLIIEVTEAAALENIKASKTFLEQLQKAGCSIALDNFGAGLTSYRSLKELPVSMIKLDGSLCRNLDEAGGNGIYVKSMIELAHALGIAVVAEWVETEKEAGLLKALGVDMIQGNMVGEPSIDVPWTMLASNDALGLAEAGQEPQEPAHPDGDIDGNLAMLHRALMDLQSALDQQDGNAGNSPGLAIAS